MCLSSWRLFYGISCKYPIFEKWFQICVRINIFVCRHGDCSMGYSANTQYLRNSFRYVLVLWVCFVDRCLFFCTFSFGHCVVCSSSIYKFWLSLWYLQTRLRINLFVCRHGDWYIKLDVVLSKFSYLLIRLVHWSLYFCSRYKMI